MGKKIRRFRAIDIAIATNRPYSTVTNYASKHGISCRDGFAMAQIIDFVKTTKSRRPSQRKTPNATDIDLIQMTLSLLDLSTDEMEASS